VRGSYDGGKTFCWVTLSAMQVYIFYGLVLSEVEAGTFQSDFYLLTRLTEPSLFMAIC